jgi:hypothetical protein
VGEENVFVCGVFKLKCKEASKDATAWKAIRFPAKKNLKICQNQQTNKKFKNFSSITNPNCGVSEASWCRAMERKSIQVQSEKIKISRWIDVK